MSHNIDFTTLAVVAPTPTSTTGTPSEPYMTLTIPEDGVWLILSSLRVYYPASSAEFAGAVLTVNGSTIGQRFENLTVIGGTIRAMSVLSTALSLNAGDTVANSWSSSGTASTFSTTTGSCSLVALKIG